MADTLKLVISPAARQDLREIYQYSLRTWGQAQSAGYLDQIREKLWMLTTQPHMGTSKNSASTSANGIPYKTVT